MHVEIDLVVIPFTQSRVNGFCGRIHAKPVHVDLPACFKVFGKKRLIDARGVLSCIAPVEFEMLRFSCVDSSQVNMRVARGEC